MKIEFEGRTWSFDMDEITVDDAERIEKETGQSMAEWSQSLFDQKPKGYRILYWLMRTQNGEPLPLEQANFRLLPFMNAYMDCVRAEVEAAQAQLEGEPDPTQPPATPPSQERPPPGQPSAAPPPAGSPPP